MLKRKLILLVLSISFLAGFFLLPANKEWARTVFSYWNGFQDQKKDLDIQSRMRRRFKTHYTYSVNIADSLRKKGAANELILMPPHTYFKKMRVNYTVPIPPVFYYFTGVKTVWANNPHAMEADWYVRVSNGKIVLDKVTDKKALQDTIIAFQKLGVYL